jgi:hypothetical protein
MFRTLKWTLCCVLVTSAMWGSTVIGFTGPSYAKPPSAQLPGGQLVIGDPFEYQVFGAQLTSPSGANPNWLLTIETNYNSVILGNSIPASPFGSPNAFFSIGDFLINWNNTLYGIVLAPHFKLNATVDGYTAGNLYQTNGFQNSGSIMGVPPDCLTLGTCSPNPDFPIWINPGATQLGTGSVTVAKTGDGFSAARYTISVLFSAPGGWLSSGPVSISFASYSCGNGVLYGEDPNTPPPPPPPDVPEPSTVALMASGLFLLIGSGAVRKRAIKR